MQTLLVVAQQLERGAYYQSIFTTIFHQLLLDMEGNSSGKSKLAVGPWGGHGGASWDDGCYSGVREIKLVYDRCMDSICLVYDKNGKPVKGEKHGGAGGSQTTEIKLNFPEEYLMSASGSYYPVVYGGSPVIKSLLFKSNKRTFGPYGVEEGTPFSFPMEGGKIVGFKGRSGWYLDAIGFHLRRVESNKMRTKLQQWLQKSLDPKKTKDIYTK